MAILTNVASMANSSASNKAIHITRQQGPLCRHAVKMANSTNLTNEANSPNSSASSKAVQYYYYHEKTRGPSLQVVSMANLMNLENVASSPNSSASNKAIYIKQDKEVQFASDECGKCRS